MKIEKETITIMKIEFNFDEFSAIRNLIANLSLNDAEKLGLSDEQYDILYHIYEEMK